MLELKYASVPFGKMDQETLKASASKLLFKISVITGWAIYENTVIQESLKEEFELKLTEAFPQVNIDEMVFAFRNNTEVKDWGKYLNLSLIDEVMIPYLDKRKELSNIEFHHAELPPSKVQDEPEMSDDEFLEMNKNIWKGSRLFGLISVKCYSILTKRGLINLSPEQKDVILKKARANFFGPENKENRLGLRFDQQENYITMDAKKIAVAEYFNGQS